MESIALKEPKERAKMFECISQSKELAAEYIRKKEALLKAKEDTQFHFNKKKSASVERKQMFKDKVEVSDGQTLFNSSHFCILIALLLNFHVKLKNGIAPVMVMLSVIRQPKDKCSHWQNNSWVNGMLLC